MDGGHPQPGYQLLLEEGVRLGKCRKCGCLKGTLDSLVRRVAGSPLRVLAEARETWRAVLGGLEPVSYS